MKAHARLCPFRPVFDSLVDSFTAVITSRLQLISGYSSPGFCRSESATGSVGRGPRAAAQRHWHGATVTALAVALAVPGGRARAGGALVPK